MYLVSHLFDVVYLICPQDGEFLVHFWVHQFWVSSQFLLDGLS